MDLMMPMTDGFTATRIIREVVDLKQTPILAGTAYGSACFERAKEVGFNDAICKPPDFENLEPLRDQYLR
jgi:CheY-like chemotaxis protein